jgi:hypothetical protein
VFGWKTIHMRFPVQWQAFKLAGDASVAYGMKMPGAGPISTARPLLG